MQNLDYTKMKGTHTLFSFKPRCLGQSEDSKAESLRLAPQVYFLLSGFRATHDVTDHKTTVT